MLKNRWLTKETYFYFLRNYYLYNHEPGAVIKGRQPKWASGSQLFETLKSDSTVVIQGAAATPSLLIKEMTNYAKERKLKNIRVYHMHTEGVAPYVQPEFHDTFRQSSFFMGGNVRKCVAEGRCDTIPIFLQEIPLLFYKRKIKPDLVLLNLSPPDKHGFCSLGTSVDCIRAAMCYARVIVAQINSKMPRTFGDSLIHIGHVDYAMKCDEPLPSHETKVAAEEEVIARYIAENLVEDGATLQMGIGAIPDAILTKLNNHKNLGIHSEMFADGVVDLVLNQNITNSAKPVHRGRTVGSFLVGSQKLYDFVNDNPAVEMLRVDYVNSTAIIKRHPKMTSINSCLEIDLTGQVNSDSIGTYMYSGFGGQVDFIRGAAEGLDGRGKPIIALRSATRRKQSKIVPFLKQGAGVVTSRAHIQYVVTEYGIANLFGKDLRQRAHALIRIAHPDSREALEKAAFNRLKVMPSP